MYIYIVTCFEGTRHRHVSKRVADFRTHCNGSTITLERGWKSAISLRYKRGHSRPDPGAQMRTIRGSTEQWETVQDLTGSSKAGRVPAQRRQFELEFRSLASLAFWLDQEEDSVQLVLEEFKELPVLSKSCWRSWNWSKWTIDAVEEIVSSDCNLLWFTI
jgi:hypothetical protein